MQKKPIRRIISLFILAAILLGTLPVSLAAKQEDVIETPSEISTAPSVYSASGGVVEVARGKRVTLSTTGISGTITWTSAKPSVATVDSSGVVTGVQMGAETTVTASVNGVVERTYTVRVLVPDGVYWIGSAIEDMYMSAESNSISSGVAAELHSLYSGKPNNLLQMWKIKYLGNSLYSIRPMHKLDMALHAGMDWATLQTAGTNDASVAASFRWTITVGAGGHAIKDGDAVLTYPENGGNDTALIMDMYDEEDPYDHWTLTEVPLILNGIVFFDTNKNELCMTPTFYPELGQTKTLAELGYIPSRYSSVSIAQNIAWSSSDATVATVNSSTGAISAVRYGKAVASALFAVGSSTYTLEYDIRICEVEVNLQVVYDEAYLARYSGAYQRVCDHIDSLESYYLSNFGLYIESTTPQAFKSYADECKCSYDRFCWEGNCCNSSVSSDDILTLKNYHHQNITNILYRIAAPTAANTFKIAYIGHEICNADSGICSRYNSNSNPVNGLTSLPLRLMTITNTESLESERRTTIHEFGHLFGALDHYGKECPSTEEMKDMMRDARFNRQCIYGEDRHNDTVTQNNIICDGCKALIEAGILSYN